MRKNNTLKNENIRPCLFCIKIMHPLTAQSLSSTEGGKSSHYVAIIKVNMNRVLLFQFPKYPTDRNLSACLAAHYIQADTTKQE